MGRQAVFTIKDIVTVLKARQDNEFDARFTVVGDTGDGKSTLITKILYRLGGFNPRKQQVYERDDILKILKTKTKSICFDDEAINSGYKRDWQDKGQQELIKILTNYRDSFNIYASALPNFFSLDKDLRDLVFMFIQITERGIGVLHLPIAGRTYTQDRWDSKNNAKIEQSWNFKMKRNPNYIPPYHKLSTFAGYIYFSKMTIKQERVYREVKKSKRAKVFEDKQEDQKTFYQKLYDSMIEGKLNTEGLQQICQMEGKNQSTVRQHLNKMLKDRAVKETAKEFLEPSKDSNNIVDGINNLIPNL